MSGIPLLDEKCIGAFVASAIGDALGWPNEFRASNTNKKGTQMSNFVEWQRRSGGRYWNHIETILAGEYSDDTQMNLAVARSLLSGKLWSNHFISYELPFWLEYERGGGSAMLRAANSWKNKIEPWKNKNIKSYFDAGGNGVAMRVLPHVIFHIRLLSFEFIADEVITDAILTHGHPRAIVGALCYAYALYYLIRKQTTLSFGELVTAVSSAKSEWGRFPTVLPDDWLNTANKEVDYRDLWDSTVEATVRSLEISSKALGKGALDSEAKTLLELGCFDKKVNGAGDIAAVAAIYLASKYANNPILGIKSAANALGSDTDTIASMTGGLLGTICGMEWIPAEWRRVQDYDCLVRIAGFLLLENGVEVAKEYVVRSRQESAQWERTSIGRCKRIKNYELQSGKIGTVRVSKFITVLGQTFYIKKFLREKTLENHPNLTSKLATQKYSFTINSSQLPMIMNNMNLNDISFLSVLKILEMINQGTTDLTLISKKMGINKETIKMMISLITPDEQENM